MKAIGLLGALWCATQSGAAVLYAAPPASLPMPQVRYMHYQADLFKCKIPRGWVYRKRPSQSQARSAPVETLTIYKAETGRPFEARLVAAVYYPNYPGMRTPQEFINSYAKKAMAPARAISVGAKGDRRQAVYFEVRHEKTREAFTVVPLTGRGEYLVFRYSAPRQAFRKYKSVFNRMINTLQLQPQSHGNPSQSDQPAGGQRGRPTLRRP